MADIGSLIVKIKADIDDLEDNLKKGKSTVSETTDEMNSMGSTMSGAVATGAAAAATAIVAVTAAAAALLITVGSVAAGFSGEYNDSMRLVEAQTGTTGAALEEFREDAALVFENNWADNINDAVLSMSQVKQITGATGDELVDLTTHALIFRDVFEKDIKESVRAVDTAVINFGNDGSEVFDMMASVIQRTGDPADDLLDTVNEYSPVFAAAGFSAGQMFAILESGLEAGARNFDVVADAVKEFQVRIIDGSDSTRDALNSLFTAVGQGSQEIANLETSLASQTQALAANEAAMGHAEAAYAASKDKVSELSSALSEAKSELNALSNPRLAGMDAIDDRLFGLSMEAKKVERAMLDMVPDTGHIQRLEDDLEDATDAVNDNASALENAEGAYATQQAVVDELSNALAEAKSELDALSQPNLAGMSEYEDQIFDVEQQIKAAQLAMLDMEEGTPEFDAAEMGLEALDESLKRLELERDLEFDSQLRDIEAAARLAEEPVVTFDEAMQNIVDKKDEIAELDTAFASATGGLDAQAAEVERLSLLQNDLAEDLAEVEAALEAAYGPSEEYLAAQAQLDAINLEMNKIALDRDIQFEPQLRAIQEAATAGQQPIMTFDEAMSSIAAKKDEIAGLDQAFIAATAEMDANAATVDSLRQQHDNLTLGIQNTQIALENAVTPADEYLSLLEDGSLTGAEAMGEVIQMLQNVDNEVLRDQIGVALFGTKWEDLKGGIIGALDPAVAGLVEVENETINAGNTVSEGFSSKWTDLKNEALLALDPLGQTILGIAEDHLPKFQGAVDTVKQFFIEAQPTFNAFREELDEKLGPAMILIEDAVTRIGVALGLATEDASGMDVAIGALETTLDLIITTLEAVAIGFQLVADAAEAAREAVDIANGLADQTGQISNAVSENDVGFLEFTSVAAGAVASEFGFADGGVVPGAVGEPHLATVHGGELILNSQQQADLAAAQGGSTGNGITIETINITASSEAGGQEAGQGFVDELRRQGLIV